MSEWSKTIQPVPTIPDAAVEAFKRSFYSDSGGGPFLAGTERRIQTALAAAMPHLRAPAPEPDGEALRARIAELEAALKPFAELGDGLREGPWAGIPDDKRVPLAGGGWFITVADLRRATDVLKKP